MIDARSPMASRRRFLVAGAATAVLAACGSGDEGASTPTTGPTGITATAASGSALTAADFESLATCRLLAANVAGPFPLDEQFDRRDVTEGSPGHPLRLGLRVVDRNCQPVAGAAVEIWHTDATGDYSAFVDNGGGKDEGDGSTFLRGTQTAGDDGIVEFVTIYPGWYPGRAVHIHLRVHRDGATVLTSQLFFDDEYTVSVFADDPYAANGPPDTTNATDGLAGDPVADGTLLHLAAAETANGAGTLGLLNLGIAEI